MALPVPPTLNNPIPNNPFYSLPAYITKGAYYPITVGAGLSVDPATAVITSTGGGGGAVSSIIAGSGISVNAATGNVTVTNTGVTNITAGTGISISGGTGNVTINSLTTGTVLAVNTGAGLTGGPITTSGTIDLRTTGVVPGTYTNPTLSVDGYGRISSALNGTSVGSVTGTLPITVTAGANPVVAINPASTASCGAVLLSDAVNSTSSATAATSLAVKTAYDIAIAAIPKSCITGVGTLITGTGPSTPVALPVGTNGQILAACSSCVGGLYWASTNVPPFGTPNYGSFLNTGTQTIGTVNVPQPVTLNTTVAASGFTLIGGSQITATNAGIYNLQFSIQLVVTTGGGGIAEIWLVKNGVAVPNSNTQFAVKNTNEAEFAALNFVESLAAGDNLQLFWATDDIHVQLISYAAGANFAGAPAIPSAIVTVVPVGA
jgi:hypothetical protein